MEPVRVLFVCLGNICRSPLAEGIFQKLAEDQSLSRYFEVDSSGTGSWHVGEPAHQNSQETALRHGVDISGHRARQVKFADFEQFDLIVAMDRSNRSDLYAIAPTYREKVICLREFDPKRNSLDVPDPYYGGADGFEECYRIIERSVLGLLDRLRGELKLPIAEKAQR